MENIGDAWHRKTAKRVGEAVAEFRKDAGMTAQQLAERCRELGVPIHRTTITKIEGGRSRFDLGELLILAAALDVPPLALVYPTLPNGPVEIIPGIERTSWDAYMWASGLVPSLTRGSTPTKGARLVEMTRQRAELKAQGGHLRIELELHGQTYDQGIRDSRESLLASITDALERTETAIRDSGGVLDA